MQYESILEPACVVVGLGEVVACGEGVDGAHKIFSVGEVLLVQGDGFVESARVLVCASEIVARGQSAGVVGSQDIARLSDGLGESKC